MNNGFSSSFFPIKRGIRQGCPISALLFIMVVEILSLHIKQNKNITGIPVEEFSVKITQLADDTTLFLQDIDSLKEVIDFLNKFKLSSGLKLNMGKTEVIWIGSESQSNIKPLGLKTAKHSVRCLGIMCNTDVNKAVMENFSIRIKKLKTLLNIWKQRSL